MLAQSQKDYEQTQLKVPVDARYARVVRMTAANIAALAGFSVDDVDDVRMAAEEAFVYACGTGVTNELTIVFSVAGSDEIDMDFEIGTDQPQDDETQTTMTYAKLLIEALCDESSISEDATHLHLIKKTGNADAL